jgi:hypothetical protein
MSINDKLTKQQAIDKLIDEFDFKSVQIALKALNWEWYEYQGVPNENQLKEYAKQLLNDAYEEGITKISSTSGFIAQYKKGREDMLVLEFNLARKGIFYIN